MGIPEFIVAATFFSRFVVRSAILAGILKPIKIEEPTPGVKWLAGLLGDGIVFGLLYWGGFFT